MKKQRLILACLLCVGMAVQAAGSLPQGKWTVTQVTVEKKTNGNLQTSVHNTAAQVTSILPCPQEWEIGTNSILLRYADGREETTQYTVDGNTFTIAATGAVQLYEYSLSGSTLTLTITQQYKYNTAVGQVDNIEEKWIISLKQ